MASSEYVSFACSKCGKQIVKGKDHVNKMIEDNMPLVFEHDMCPDGDDLNTYRVVVTVYGTPANSEEEVKIAEATTSVNGKDLRSVVEKVNEKVSATYTRVIGMALSVGDV